MRNEKKCCIDSCVWIKYAGYHKVTRLFYFIIEEKMIVFADNYLLSEIHEALIEEFSFSLSEADKAIRLISQFVIINTPHNIYRMSRDAKDNYLYDLCIQNNCRYLITIDKEIIADTNAPFIRKTDAWLKKKKK